MATLTGAQNKLTHGMRTSVRARNVYTLVTEASLALRGKPYFIQQRSFNEVSIFQLAGLGGSTA
jgi:hypothetical protein